MLGVLIHLVGDALNNIGVMISALVIWLTKYEGRFYADPAASMAIACMIMLTSAPLGVSNLFAGLLQFPYMADGLFFLISPEFRPHSYTESSDKRYLR